MKRSRIPQTVLRSVWILTGIAFLTLTGLWALSHLDNKYSAKTQILQKNTVLLPEGGTSFLVDGWELYPDRLLTPDDFLSETPTPCHITWAGEYPNLALFHEDKDPYGTATYRLRLQGEGTAVLYLQEPLCAARVFVDGQDLGGPGEVAAGSYRPLIRDTVYSFPVDGQAELIIQTANYSHYYGGLWFPPAIGDGDSISHLIASRMVFYSLLCFTSLALALFCIVLWLGKPGRKDPASFYFGLLCLTFALRVCYPFLRLWGVSVVPLFYALEDGAALTGLYCAVRISLLLFFPKGLKYLHQAASVLSLGMCGVSVVFPLVVLPVFPSLTLWYGPLVSWYKVLTAVFLIAAALRGSCMGTPHALPVLAAVTSNGICLFYGVLSIGHFEPILGGWPEEYGAFSMVLVFAALMVQRSQAMASENLRLNEHLKEEVAEKTSHLRLLLTERGQLMAELGHDMKSPLTALSNMAQIIRLNDIMLDEDIREKMQGIEDKCGLLADRLRSIQELAQETGTLSSMEPVLLNKFLMDFHRTNQPVIELTGPEFLCQLTQLPCKVLADREKLSRALENLVFNASEFTPPEGIITLSLERGHDCAMIRISDTGCGIPENELPKVFRRYYTSRSSDGGQGLGLAITHSIILEHDGEITVESQVGQGATFIIHLPLLPTP